MVRPSNEIIQAWASLSSNNADSGWKVISLAPAGSVQVFAGRHSPDNAEAILFHFPKGNLPRSERLPEGKGFLVERADLTGKDGFRLALARQTEGNLELFTSMVCDVLNTIDAAAKKRTPESGLLEIFIRRVRAWQHFMSRDASPLGPEAELGLAGELHFMALLLDAGVLPETLLEGWAGPKDASQDFYLGIGAIEVKATMSSSGFPVKIGSLEQLDHATVAPLFLAAVRFAIEEGGATLPEMVTEVEHRLENETGVIDILQEHLMGASYIKAHAGQYFRKFKPKESCIFSVTDGFPRLTPRIVPAGVTRASYEINLDHAGNFLCNIDDVLLQLGVTG
jgi:hypothetical protein